MNYILIKEGLVNVGFDKPQEYIQALRKTEEPAIWIVEKLIRGRKLKPEDIDLYFEEHSLREFESLVRKRLVSAIVKYARIKDIHVSPEITCNLLGYENQDYIRVLIHRGKLKGRKEKDRWTISLASILEFIEEKEKDVNIEKLVPKFLKR